MSTLVQKTEQQTPFQLIDLDSIKRKKVNLAVAKMKDYFLVKSSFYTPSKYLMKVKDIPNKQFYLIYIQLTVYHL